MKQHLCRIVAGLSAICLAFSTAASDHLDTPTVIADPAADIGDLYAWMSPDGQRVNLVMNIVSKRFSDRIAYVFHVDSGHRFGTARATTTIDCRFDAQGQARCDAAGDRAAGKTDVASGIESTQQVFRVFAGLRDDPFANNVRGTRQGYEVAEQALAADASKDVAGCPAFDSSVAAQLLDRWRHTDGGAAKNFLAGWKTAALVVSIDARVVRRGGPLLAVWAGTYALGTGHTSAWGARLDRVGRTLTGNALLGLLQPKDIGERRKAQYNAAAQKHWHEFAPDIEASLALYDAFDGICGNQWRAARAVTPARYRSLSKVLADDRLWIDSRQKQCTRFMAVERGENTRLADCGGRTPDGDAVDVYRSLLVNGTQAGVEDGIVHDDKVHGTVDFPFLAEP